MKSVLSEIYDYLCILRDLFREWKEIYLFGNSLLSEDFI